MQSAAPGFIPLAPYSLGYWALLNVSIFFVSLVGIALLAWTGFAGFRLWTLAKRRAYRPDSAEWDREDFGFWLGAVLSSVLLSA